MPRTVLFTEYKQGYCLKSLPLAHGGEGYPCFQVSKHSRLVERRPHPSHRANVGQSRASHPDLLTLSRTFSIQSRSSPHPVKISHHHDKNSSY